MFAGTNNINLHFFLGTVFKIVKVIIFISVICLRKTHQTLKLFFRNTLVLLSKQNKHIKGFLH